MAGRLLPCLALLVSLWTRTVGDRNRNALKESEFGEAFILDVGGSSADSKQKTAFYTQLKARIVPDDWCGKCSSSARTVCNCASPGTLKPLRPVDKFHVTATEITAALENGGEYSKPLSSWAAFANLQVAKIVCRDSAGREKRRLKPLALDEYRGLMEKKVELKKRCGDVSKLNMAAVFELPEWTGNFATGWHNDNPGFVFWARVGSQGPSMLYGSDVKNPAQQSAAAVYMYAHQYAQSGSNRLDVKLRDYLIHHAGILVEWQDNPGYTTVYELALRNGLAGYQGKSNYYPASADEGKISQNKLDQMFRDSGGMHQPWITSLSEVRILDIDHAPDLNGFKHWMATAPNFREAQVVFFKQIGPSRTTATRTEIHEAVWNSIVNDGVYDERSRNCQTWAVDLYKHLTGETAAIRGHDRLSTAALGMYMQPAQEQFGPVSSAQ